MAEGMPEERSVCACVGERQGERANKMLLVSRKETARLASEAGTGEGHGKGHRQEGAHGERNKQGQRQAHTHTCNIGERERETGNGRRGNSRSQYSRQETGEERRHRQELGTRTQVRTGDEFSESIERTTTASA